MIPEHLRPILQYPSETWTVEERVQVREYRSRLHAKMVAIADEAERQDRDLSDEERVEFDALKDAFHRLSGTPVL